MIEGKLNDTGAGLLYGQVGGGPGSFIGPVHRAAIAMNNQARLVAGSFSGIPEKTAQAGKDLGIDPERTYTDFNDMAVKEGARKDRIDFVVITVPNDLHYAVAKAFLVQGINVVCEKPMAFTEEEAKDLVALVRQHEAEFMVTYTYTGYPMVREARNLVQTGTLGTLRVVSAEYPQGWLADPVEKSGTNRQAVWRTDPKYAGVSCCVGDIGTHIENLVHFVTGLEIEKLAASLETFVEGRPLDDNAYMLLKYKGGASGNYWSSQVAIGKENGLRIRVYGTEGAIEWEHENPNVPEEGWSPSTPDAWQRVSVHSCGSLHTPSSWPSGRIFRSVCEPVQGLLQRADCEEGGQARRSPGRVPDRPRRRTWDQVCV
jgi:predicted dehydrogenase